MLTNDFPIAITSSSFRALSSNSLNGYTWTLFCIHFQCELGKYKQRKNPALVLGNIYLCTGPAINSLGALGKFLNPSGSQFPNQQIVVVSYI